MAELQNQHEEIRPESRPGESDLPGLPEEINEGFREYGEWGWWGLDPVLFTLFAIEEGIRRRVRHLIRR